MPPKSSRAQRAKKRGAGQEEQGKRRKKSKLPTNRTVAAAPVAAAPAAAVAVDEEENVEEVEPEKAKSKRERNYIEEEDVYLSIAYVNISQDGAVATNQKMEDFWGRIQEKFTEQQSKCTACKAKKQPPRDWKSLRNRFDRKIRTGVFEFNSFYKPLKTQAQSGAQPEDIIREAHDKYLATIGRPFPFSKCVEVLWGIPKFDPMIGDVSDNAVNEVARVMGQDLSRPEGSKKQKAAAKDQKKSKPDPADIASFESDKVASIREMSLTSRSMADSMQYQADINGAQAIFQASVEEARLLQSMGMADEAMEAVRRSQASRAELERLRAARLNGVPLEVNAPVNAPVAHAAAVEPAADA